MSRQPNKTDRRSRTGTAARWEVLERWLQQQGGQYTSTKLYGVARSICDLYAREWPERRTTETYAATLMRLWEDTGLLDVTRTANGTPVSIRLARPVVIPDTVAISPFLAPPPALPRGATNEELHDRLNVAYIRIADLEAQMIQCARVVKRIEAWAQIVSVDLGVNPPVPK